MISEIKITLETYAAMNDTQQSYITEVWRKCTFFLEKLLEKPTFEMCIKPMYPVSLEGNVLKLESNAFALNLLKKKPECINLIEEVVKNTVSSECVVDITESGQKQEYEKEEYTITSAPFPDEEQKEEYDKELAGEKKAKSHFSSLIINPKYTFDTFVVGDSNNLAFSASLAVATKPGKAYNPLFIYGGVGLGKTHLLQAIAHTVTKNNPKSKIEYISTERFAYEMIRHLQEGKIVKFKEKYRSVDVLLIDDIQFLIGKEGTQDEFFHTFNELHGAGKQIVISSDRLPKEIPNIHDRLRSRFEWGLTVDIQQPDIETRQAILLRKAESEKIKVPFEVISYIAEQINTNIRELEGALIKVIARASLLNKEVDIELAHFALKDILPNKEGEITPELIKKCVAQYFGIEISDLSSSKRDQKYAYPRHIAMYLTRELTNMSYLDIARVMGKNDHTTVKHGYDKIVSRMETSSDRTKINIDNIKNNIKERL